jgi:nucleoside-diphosphate-sugar epimerase
MSEGLHVIFGTGPAGCWIANSLVERGERVRVVNRSGRRPGLLPSAAELVTADVSDERAAVEAAAGAAVVYQALNPPYHQWHELFPGLQRGALAAARKAGARYVSIDNLYLYDPSAGPITEDSRVAPKSRKGELRARMAEEVLAAHERGEVEAVVLRSSDYYGPGVTGSALGDRVFPAVLAGKHGEVLGRPDAPHSYAYIEDVGRAATELGVRDEALGRVWIAPHAPAPTQHEVLETIFELAGRSPRYTTVTPFKMRLAGLFAPGAREMVEMMYEFNEPFTVDSSAIRNGFGLEATPIAEGLARTVAWYQEQGGQA